MCDGRMTTKSTTYKPVPSAPSNLIWITPRRHQGQIVEVSYATGVPAGRGVNYDADSGDPWKRVEDHSTGQVSYYRLAK